MMFTKAQTNFLVASLIAAPITCGAAGLWSSTVVTDQMTDKKTCYAVTKADPFVKVETAGAFTVNYRQRGGVSAFQWRVDDHPAAPAQMAPRNRSDAIIVAEVSHDLLQAKRLRIVGETVLGQPIKLDYDLKGLAEAVAAAKKRCGE